MLRLLAKHPQFIIACSIFFSSILFCAHAAKEPTIHYNFTQDKTKYSIHASFYSPLPAREILDTLLNYQHVKEFTKSVGSVRLDGQGEGWNRITYKQCEVFGCIEATFLRQLEGDDGELKFIQVESHTDGFLIPRVKSSSGYYRVLTQPNGSRVEYFQVAELEKSFLLSIYQNSARTSTRDFIQDLFEYLQKTIK